ncbi:hypothetical protein GCM10010470_49970 [Saccharopolyspora taberi]|uniref:Uncharacterized protein n=1 Tax=Saccharopolyspora taberi TaxID=60895 RepID=A0ABN3VJ29_9PSEU
MLDVAVLHRRVQREDRGAGAAERDVDAFGLQDVDDCLHDRDFGHGVYTFRVRTPRLPGAGRIDLWRERAALMLGGCDRLLAASEVLLPRFRAVGRSRKAAPGRVCVDEAARRRVVTRDR